MFDIDHCFMGQIRLGLLKSLSCGGLGIWFLMDHCTIMYNGVTKDGSIDILGFKGSFDPDSIQLAFWISSLLLCLHLVNICVGFGFALARRGLLPGIGFQRVRSGRTRE